jgi:hypothetical protein
MLEKLNSQMPNAKCQKKNGILGTETPSSEELPLQIERYNGRSA